MDYPSSPPSVGAGARSRGINFKKIDELRNSFSDQDAAKLRKQVQIFYKKDPRSTNEPWLKITAEFLAIASETYRSAIWDDNVKSITITGDDKAMYQQVLDWLIASFHQSPAGAAPWPVYDEENPLVFLQYARLIKAAKELGIPGRDFAEPIIKKYLFKLSRESFMSWEEVDFYLDTFAGDSDTDKMMREVLTNSIANAWWKRKFRENAEDDDQDDYCILSVLRAEHSQLDKDLHKWCEDNEARIRAKWAEKDSVQDAPSGANAGGKALGNNDFGWTPNLYDGAANQGIAMADSGYDSAGGAAPSIESLGVGGGDWENSGTGGNWGDEVNAYEQQRYNTVW